MNAFAIFAIALTVVYIIYYAVTISRDLYGSKKVKSSEEETIDIPDSDDEESSTEVSEVGDGFSLSTDSQDDSSAPEKEEAPHEDKPVVSDSNVEIDEDSNTKVMFISSMEDMHPDYQYELESSEFVQCLTQGKIPADLIKMERTNDEV